jgi:RNA 3'-terminal phosphate cyclase (ATP)
MLEQGGVREIRGISMSSHLEKQRVSERMADRCQKLLARENFEVHIGVHHDSSAVQKGAALMLWTETQTGAILGADQAGKAGRSSESIAELVVRSLLEDLRTGATTDRHLADQLILFAALARGLTTYVAPMITDHVTANLWLVEKVLGAKTSMEGARITVDGIGLLPSQT